MADFLGLASSVVGTLALFVDRIVSLSPRRSLLVSRISRKTLHNSQARLFRSTPHAPPFTSDVHSPGGLVWESSGRPSRGFSRGTGSSGSALCNSILLRRCGSATL